MTGKIFINYRRGDDPGYTMALYQRLEDTFPGDLFMDVEGGIEPGEDFVEVLNDQVAACDLLLVVIGPRWADLLRARASDPNDFVAIEIEAALNHGKRVVPVLVGGAVMPRIDTLPGSLRALARRNAVRLSPERFKADCLGLVGVLKEQLAAERERIALMQAAAEAEQRKRGAEEAQIFSGSVGQDSGEVFISYKRERRRAAEHLGETLRRYGYGVWFDYQFVKGRDFGLAIDTRIRAAKALIVLWCTRSVGSKWVSEEVDLAKVLGILIPAKIEDCELPVGNRLKDYIDLTQWNGSPCSHQLDALLAAVAGKVGRDPVPNYHALREYEATWRRFGAPPLKAFALDQPLEASVDGREVPEHRGR
jgi:hypothetical protein